MLAPCRRPVPMKTAMSSISIFVPPLAAWVQGQPVDDRSRTHACERPHTLRAVPLISGHQRPAAAGDFRPRIIYGQGQDTRAHSNWPGPGPPRTTNKVTGLLSASPWPRRSSSLVQGRAHPLARGPGRAPTPPEPATAELVHWYGHHPTPLRHRHANPRRARSRLGTRHPPPGTITTGNHRHQINQPPQNPGLDTLPIFLTSTWMRQPGQGRS